MSRLEYTIEQMECEVIWPNMYDIISVWLVVWLAV